MDYVRFTHFLGEPVADPEDIQKYYILSYHPESGDFGSMCRMHIEKSLHRGQPLGR